MGLVSELRRRNVLRMALVYLVTAWLIIQVVEVVMTLLGLPEWVGRVTLAVLAIGLPISLLFSWFYELTPEGVKLDKDVDPVESISRVSGRRLDFVVISVLAAALIVFAYEKWWTRGDTVTDPAAENSIAVLPLENLSGNSEQQYFVSGMHDALISSLSRISALRVTSRTSTMRYKDTIEALPLIAAKLGVAKLIEGSIFWVDDRVRITVRLVDAGTDEHIWSETFENEISDVMKLQSEVAQAIASRIEVKVTPAEQAQFQRAAPVNAAAYDAFLKGKFHAERFTPEDLELAAQYFLQAVKLDPNYALAYWGLSFLCAAQSQAGLIRPQEARERCLPPIRRALRLDDSLPEAHLGYAVHMIWREFKWGEGDAGFRRAIALNPNYAEARMFYSHYLTLMGRPEDGSEQMRLALQLDPLNPFVRGLHGVQLWMIGDAHGAIEVIEEVMASTPGFGFGYVITWLAYHELGERDKAIAAAANHFRITRGHHAAAQALEETYAKGDYSGALLHAAYVLAEIARNAYVMPTDVAMLYDQAGDLENAIAWYERGYREYDSDAPYLPVIITTPELKSNPRIVELLREMKLDYWADTFSRSE